MNIKLKAALWTLLILTVIGAILLSIALIPWIANLYIGVCVAIIVYIVYQIVFDRLIDQEESHKG